ncbi:MAG TPA: ribose-phosphate pyrophosphokinase-like domain-containing protein, partial [Candidatus Margulisiibacteriota bacterium]|nr:ribose-phosphate pyrophosphokinase-like domain-containing protein [Candidatus Margulisiibacteriota bacterium]
EDTLERLTSNYKKALKAIEITERAISRRGSRRGSSPVKAGEKNVKISQNEAGLHDFIGRLWLHVEALCIELARRKFNIEISQEREALINTIKEDFDIYLNDIGEEFKVAVKYAKSALGGAVKEIEKDMEPNAHWRLVGVITEITRHYEALSNKRLEKRRRYFNTNATRIERRKDKIIMAHGIYEIPEGGRKSMFQDGSVYFESVWELFRGIDDEIENGRLEAQMLSEVISVLKNALAIFETYQGAGSYALNDVDEAKAFIYLANIKELMGGFERKYKVDQKEVAQILLRATEGMMLYGFRHTGTIQSFLEHALYCLELRVRNLDLILERIRKGKLNEARQIIEDRNRDLLQKVNRGIVLIQEGNFEWASKYIMGMRHRYDIQNEPDLEYFPGLLSGANDSAKEGNTKGAIFDMELARQSIGWSDFTRLKIAGQRDEIIETELKERRVLNEDEQYQLLLGLLRSEKPTGPPNYVKRWYFRAWARLYQAAFIHLNIDDPSQPSQRIPNPVFKAASKYIYLLDIHLISILLAKRRLSKAIKQHLEKIQSEAKREQIMETDLPGLVKAIAAEDKLDDEQEAILAKCIFPGFASSPVYTFSFTEAATKKWKYQIRERHYKVGLKIPQAPDDFMPVIEHIFREDDEFLQVTLHNIFARDIDRNAFNRAEISYLASDMTKHAFLTSLFLNNGVAYHFATKPTQIGITEENRDDIYKGFGNWSKFKPGKELEYVACFGSNTPAYFTNFHTGSIVISQEFVPGNTLKEIIADPKLSASYKRRAVRNAYNTLLRAEEEYKIAITDPKPANIVAVNNNINKWKLIDMDKLSPGRDLSSAEYKELLDDYYADFMIKGSSPIGKDEGPLFLGTYKIKVDSKKRILLPAAISRQLGPDRKMFAEYLGQIGKWQAVFQIIPEFYWVPYLEEKKQEIEITGQFDANNSDIFSKVVKVKVDNSWRIILDKAMLSLAKGSSFERVQARHELYIVGAGKFFLIADKSSSPVSLLNILQPYAGITQENIKDRLFGARILSDGEEKELERFKLLLPSSLNPAVLGEPVNVGADNAKNISHLIKILRFDRGFPGVCYEASVGLAHILRTNSFEGEFITTRNHSLGYENYCTVKLLGEIFILSLTQAFYLEDKKIDLGLVMMPLEYARMNSENLPWLTKDDVVFRYSFSRDGIINAFSVNDPISALVLNGNKAFPRITAIERSGKDSLISKVRVIYEHGDAVTYIAPLFLVDKSGKKDKVEKILEVNSNIGRLRVGLGLFPDREIYMRCLDHEKVKGAKIVLRRAIKSAEEYVEAMWLLHLFREYGAAEIELVLDGKYSADNGLLSLLKNFCEKLSFASDNQLTVDKTTDFPKQKIPFWVDLIAYRHKRFSSDARQASRLITASSRLVHVRSDSNNPFYWRAQLPKDIKGKNIFFIHSTESAKDIVGLWLMLLALRREGAGCIALLNTYLGYMRQDKVFNTGEIITAKAMLELIDIFVDFNSGLNIHFGGKSGWVEFGGFRVYNINAFVQVVEKLFEHAVTFIKSGIRGNVDVRLALEREFKRHPLLVVGPDDGAFYYALEAANALAIHIKQRYHLDIPVYCAYLDKTRISSEKVVIPGYLLDQEGRTVYSLGKVAVNKSWVLLADDQTSSGGTIRAADFALVVKMMFKWSRVLTGVVQTIAAKGLHKLIDQDIEQSNNKYFEPKPEYIDAENEEMLPRLFVTCASLDTPAGLPDSNIASIRNTVNYAVKKVIGGSSSPISLKGIIALAAATLSMLPCELQAQDSKIKEDKQVLDLSFPTLYCYDPAKGVLKVKYADPGLIRISKPQDTLTVSPYEKEPKIGCLSDGSGSQGRSSMATQARQFEKEILPFIEKEYPGVTNIWLSMVTDPDPKVCVYSLTKAKDYFKGERFSRKGDGPS